MSTKYELDFTNAFWKAVDELGLDRSDVEAISVTLARHPSVGRGLGGKEQDIRVWDVGIGEHGHFRWHYIVDHDIKVVMNVRLDTCDPDQTRDVANDMITVARLVEIALRILAGG